MSDQIQVAIVAGSFAIFGGLIVQLIHLVESSKARRHERLKLLRQKYEELAMAVAETVIAIGKATHAKSLEELADANAVIPARKVFSLSLLYFPEVKGAASSYSNTLAAFHNCLVEGFVKHGTVNAGTSAALEFDMEKLTQSIASSRQTLDDAIEKHAPKYTRA